MESKSKEIDDKSKKVEPMQVIIYLFNLLSSVNFFTCIWFDKFN